MVSGAEGLQSCGLVRGFSSFNASSVPPSLTIEVKRAKGPNPANDRDAVFERGSTTTYSSFRKKTHSKAWSSEGLIHVNDLLGSHANFVHFLNA